MGFASGFVFCLIYFNEIKWVQREFDFTSDLPEATRQPWLAWLVDRQTGTILSR